MKKLLLFFGLICLINLMSAQETVTIHQNGHDFQVSAVRSVTDYPASNIQFWVGNGSNSVVAVFKWCQNTTMGIAYGYRWDGSATIYDMLTGIAAADSRFTVTFNSSNTFINNIMYQDDSYNEYFETDGYCTYTFNGGMASGLSDALTNNGYFELEEWGDCYPFPTTTMIVPATDPNGGTSTDPVDASLPFSQLLYWVGSGSNSAEFIVNFAQPDTAFAWGYRFDGTTTAQAMIDAIAAADPRFWTVGSPSLDGDIHFVLDNGDTLGLSPVDPEMGYNFWWTNLNGVSAGSGSSETLHNNDVFKYGDMNSAIGWDPLGSYFLQEAWVKVPTPVTPPAAPIPDEATIATNDILYWVGTGSNEAVMAVNWADTALAWGYRWDGTATVADMMAHIAAADPRFSYVLGSFGIDDINYIDTAAGMTTPLGVTPGNYWESKNNGFMDAGMGQTLANGDFEKWADPAAGIVVDSTYWDGWGWSYTYVYPMTITPVTVPDTTGGSGPDTIPEHGPFCGGVGTDGCNAIAVDDNQFVAWATNVVLTRGPQNISNPNSPLASFGDETNAIGPATPNNSMEAVSLGDGGSALVIFERPIRNGEGPDFAVFENDINGGFLELAFVEVSSDGVHFVRFPATSLTQTETQTGSFAFTDPTFINNLAGKFQIGYGTPFDLEELADSANLNIDSIVYVRIIDVVGNIDPQYATYDAFGHIVNDPWPTDFASCGFDLTGVGVIHQKPVGIESHEMPQVFAYPNPCTGTLYIINENAERVELYNLNGKLLQVVDNGDTHVTLNMQSYPAGLYLLKVGNGVQKILNK
jgi:hypothetical protein